MFKGLQTNATMLKSLVNAERFLIKKGIISNDVAAGAGEVEDTWEVKASLSETRCIRRYYLSTDKTVIGVGNAILQGIDMTLFSNAKIEQIQNGIKINCNEHEVLKLLGSGKKIWINLTLESNKLCVVLYIPYNENIEMYSSLLNTLSARGAGGTAMGMARGAISWIRSTLLNQIDNAIKEYLCQ